MTSSTFSGYGAEPGDKTSSERLMISSTRWEKEKCLRTGATLMLSYMSIGERDSKKLQEKIWVSEARYAIQVSTYTLSNGLISTCTHFGMPGSVNSLTILFNL